MKRTRTQKFTILYFWLILTNFFHKVEIPILHQTVMESILINTPKMKQSRGKKTKKTRLNNGKVITKRQLLVMIFSPTVYFRLKYDGIKTLFE